MTEKKRVGMLLTAEFPPDNRVNKEAKSLVNAGFELYLLSLNHSNRPATEELNGYKIVRFFMPKFFHKKLSPLYLLLPIYRWIWVYQVQKFIEKYGIEILHIHDLPLTDIGVMMKRKYGIKLVADQHEYYSNRIKSHAHYNTKIGKIVNLLSNWDAFEKKYLPEADLIITVEAPMISIYTDTIGISKEKLVAVPNTPDKDEARWIDLAKTERIPKRKDFVVLYVGVVDVQRGLDQMVRALPILREKIPNLVFRIAGRMAKNTGFFQLADELGVRDMIDFVGWKSGRELADVLVNADVGISLDLPTSEQLEMTIPTKIYQYLLAGLPVIVTDRKYMKEFVEGNGVGSVFSTGNIEELTDKILQIFDKTEDIQNIEKHVSQVKDNIHWEETVKALQIYYLQWKND
jgi:glycosyltransferase involved in cell wall biosynthesis